MSASGALLRTPLPLPLHAFVLVQLPRALENKDRSRRRPAIPGEVVRHVEGGFAIEWTELSPPAIREMMRRDGEPQAEPAPAAHKIHAR